MVNGKYVNPVLNKIDFIILYNSKTNYRRYLILSLNVYISVLYIIWYNF